MTRGPECGKFSGIGGIWSHPGWGVVGKTHRAGKGARGSYQVSWGGLTEFGVSPQGRKKLTEPGRLQSLDPDRNAGNCRIEQTWTSWADGNWGEKRKVIVRCLRETMSSGCEGGLGNNHLIRSFVTWSPVGWGSCWAVLNSNLGVRDVMIPWRGVSAAT